MTAQSRVRGRRQGGVEQVSDWAEIGPEKGEVKRREKRGGWAGCGRVAL